MDCAVLFTFKSLIPTVTCEYVNNDKKMLNKNNFFMEYLAIT